MGDKCLIMSLLGRIKYNISWYLLGGKQRAEIFARQREENQQHCYDYPPENNGWKKYGDKPVLGDVKTGTLFDPYVSVNENEFVMVVSERKSGNLILLRSNDGMSWGEQTTILTRKKKTWEDTVNRACILFVDNKWHIWYTGQKGRKSRIGHLTSDSFKHFSRYSNNQPVITPTLPEEGDSVMNPCVLWNVEKHIFQMWYAAGENYEPDMIFYAESTDGDNWHKRETPVLEKLESHEWEAFKVGGCDVKRLKDGTYIIYYIGYQNLDVTRICFATSVDGIHWERTSDNYCISPSKNSWDSDACYKPSVVEKDGEYYMWYNGRRETFEYIGLAKKKIE